MDRRFEQAQARRWHSCETFHEPHAPDITASMVKKTRSKRLHAVCREHQDCKRMARSVCGQGRKGRCGEYGDLSLASVGYSCPSMEYAGGNVLDCVDHPQRLLRDRPSRTCVCCRRVAMSGCTTVLLLPTPSPLHVAQHMDESSDAFRCLQ